MTTRLPLLAAAVLLVVLAQSATGQALSITGPASLPSPWTQGVVYPATTVTATGGTAPYTWSATGLPPGLSIAPATGIISGTPTTSVGSPFSVTVTVTDNVAATANRTYSIPVNPPLTVTTASVPSPWTQGVAYPSTTLTATGGTGTPTWALAPGSLPLPGGLTLSPAGVLSGTPTAAGIFPFTVRATDTVGATADQALSVTVNAPLTVTTASVPSPWTQGVAYPSTTLTATGGTGTPAWALAPGSLPLPGGLTFSPAGVLSGTPTAAGTFPFTVRATDTVGATADKSFSIAVNAPLTVTTASVPSPWIQGVAYPSTTLTATGGTGTPTWALAPGSGPLPGGLTLSAAGALAGTPTVPGTFPFTVRATDTVAATADQALSITINTPLTFTTTPVPSPWTQGVAYPSTPLGATGGTGTLTWALAPGSLPLPGGLTLSAAGVLSGTPTAAGTFPFTVRVTDTVGATADKGLSITVNASLTITTTSVHSPWVQGVAYPNTPLTTSGGTGTPAWSLAPTSGPLPGGLSLSAAGVLSGTPTAAGTFPFTVRATDTVGATADQGFSVTIIPALVITSTALPSGTVGAAYAANLQATGGTGAYTWSSPSGLPAWLTLNPSTGALTGTPTAQGNYFFTVRVIDSGTPTQQTDKSLSIGVVVGLTVVTSALPAGAVGAPYSQSLTAAGGAAPYTWSITAGSLPPGLTLSGGGQISGTPTAVGTYSFTVQVTDSTSATATKPLSITITSALTITTASALPEGVVGRSYSAMLFASGGTPPYSNWVVVSGALPGGLSLGVATGLISGVPVAAGPFSFVVQVSDSASLTATKPFTLTISSGLSITTTSLPGAVTGVSYSQVLAATGGTAPYVWSVVSGSLPPGILLTPGTGALSGVPTAAGSYAFGIRVTDSASTPATAARDFVLTVSEGLTITSASQLPGGSAGTAYSTTLTAVGGRAPYTWSVAAGSLPSGLTLSPSTGVLSGTPAAAGSFSFTVQVTDSTTPTPQAASKQMALTVAAGLTVATTSLPGGATGAAYSQALAAAGGAAPYSWAIISGALPPGLTLAAGGQLSGTPTTAGAFNFTVEVTDGVGRKARQELSLTITSGLTITTEATLPSGTVGVSYAVTLAATGGTPPYSDWRQIGGILPTGLALEASTGRLSGVPTAAGTLKFTVQVKDATGLTGNKEFTITIQAAGLAITSASPLPAGVVGRAYSQDLQASGGVPPYTWAVTEGSLPAGLTLAASTGQIRGTPSAPGASSFTVEVTDSARKTASRAFSLTVGLAPLPAVQIVTSSETAQLGGQATVRLTLASGYPLALTGQLTLALQSDAVNPADDSNDLQFSPGGRSVSFTVAANSTQAVFPVSSLGLQYGTVAGTITLRATLRAGATDVTPSPAPVKVMVLARAAPVIRSVRVERTASGFDVLVTGFSSPRQVTQAVFRFTPASGANLQTSELSLPMTALSDQWFQGQESRQYGSQFTLRQAFSVQGNVQAISSVSVTLVNGSGASAAMSGAM